jgi:sec-independent protein translocase protein TatC
MWNVPDARAHLMGLTMDPNPQLQTVATPAADRVGRRWRPRLRVPFRRGRELPPRETEQMSLVGHLVELRNRLIISALSLLPGTILGFINGDQIIHVLKSPLPNHGEALVALGLTEPFLIHIEVAITTGIIVAMPVVLYEFWAFISPGLTPRERTTARPWVPLALVFFALGVGVAYFILPYATGFLYGYQSADIKLMLTAENYFSFVTTLFVAFGLVMEFPIVLVLLSKVGIVSSRLLRSSRRMAVLFITVFSAIVTPGADLVSPVVMAVVMYGLYEASIVMIRMGGK